MKGNEYLIVQAVGSFWAVVWTLIATVGLVRVLKEFSNK